MLPSALLQLPAPSGVGRAPAAASDRPAVLIVEDDPGISRMLKLVFQRAALPAIAAGDGAEALQLFGRHAATVALVFVDCCLPDMDGGALCRRLRELAPGMPVILASGYGHRSAYETLMAEGPTIFLAKPFLPTELAGHARALLSGSDQAA